MSSLNPLKSKLKSLHTRVINLTRDVIDLAGNAQTSDELAQELEKSLLTLVETVMELRTSTSRGAAKGRELGDVGDIADRLSDAVLSIDNLQLLNRLNYVELADLMGKVDPDLLEVTFTELSTYPGGWERIKQIQKIAAEKLSKNGRVDGA